MAQRGAHFDTGPNACPFVALELDRDRRSERPDYRHRCYAEQVPAPRTIAHQERYCLSPNFSGCPIFQDWAVRAAARPVPLPPGYEGRRAVPPPEVRSTAPEPLASTAAAAVTNEQWPDSMAPTPADVVADDQHGPAAAQQLSAFDVLPAASAVQSPMTPPVDTPPDTPLETPAEPPFEPPLEPPVDLVQERRAYVPPPGRIETARVTGEPPLPEARTPDRDLDEPAPIPAFLAGRSARERLSPTLEDKVAREDVVPSWEISDRYGAQAPREPRGGDGTFGRILTIAAVIIILALGVATVILVPGLLAGNPGSTNRPSFVAAPPGSPSLAPTGDAVVPSPTTSATSSPVGTLAPTPEATQEPSPEASPRSYRIKAGDTLAKIARRFDTTIQEILAANPQIPNADHIQVGQVIVIPGAAPGP